MSLADSRPAPGPLFPSGADVCSQRSARPAWLQIAQQDAAILRAEGASDDLDALASWSVAGVLEFLPPHISASKDRKRRPQPRASREFPVEGSQTTAPAPTNPTPAQNSPSKDRKRWPPPRSDVPWAGELIGQDGDMAYSVVRDFVVDDRDMRLHSSGVGPPILLLHELAGSARAFGPATRYFCAAGREAVALDLPGHGHSAAVPGSDLDGTAWAVAGALDEVTSEPVDIVGVDFGAYLGLSVAALFGDRVRRLVVVEPLAPPPAGRAPATIVPVSQRARGAFTALRKGWPGRHELGRMHSTLEQLRTADPAWWSGLATISSPTLVIDTGDSTPGKDVDLGALADAIPGSKRLSAAAGNRVWRVDPKLFSEMVLSFLDQ